MTNSLFTPPDQGNEPPATDPTKNYLEELVGEGKKFKDPVELARGKVEADAFIERMKRENEGLRSELNTRITLEQYLDKIGSGNQNGRSDPEPKEPNSDGSNASLKTEDIEKIIESKVSERERQRVQNQNRAEVQRKLTETFGPDYISKLKEVGTATGMSAEELDSLAARSPAAFMKIVGADQAPAPTPGLFVPPTGQTTPRVVTGERTNKYYKDLKAKDPKAYWLPATQNQMHKDALRLGENFFDS